MTDDDLHTEIVRYGYDGRHLAIIRVTHVPTGSVLLESGPIEIPEVDA